MDYTNSPRVKTLGELRLKKLFENTKNKNTMKKVWFITGCSTGFGRAIASHVLSIGQHVVITARNISDISDLVVGNESAALALSLDVTKPEQISTAVNKAIEHFGQIDELVNK